MIFISYCRLDLDLVRRLVRALKDQGREVWIDEEGIPPAGPIKAEICSAIEQAERFIFVLSPDSVASAYCRTELQHAVENKKSLIPVVCRHVPNADVPQALTDLDWISFREADAFELALEELRSALDTDIEQIRQHTRLENRAREWDRERRPASLLLRGEDLDGVEKLLPSIAKSIPSAYRELEHEYVASSRKEQSRRQRLVVRSLAAALGVAVLLTVTAVWFWVLARLNASKVKTELVHQLVANGFRDQENASPSASLPWFAKSQEYSEDEVAAEMARARMATVLRQSPTLANLWRPSNSETLLDAGAGGLRALTMTKNRTLRVWDTTKGSSSAGTPLRHDGWFCAKLIADGRRVVSEAPHSLIVWDAEDGRLVARIEKQMPERSTSQGQAENARRVIVLPEPARPESTYEAGSRFVMTFHRDGAKVWDAEDGRLIGERLTVPAPHGAHLILSRDGRRVLAHHDGTVTVIDVRTGKPFPPLQGIDAEVMGVDISGDARLVTTVCEVVPVDTGRSTSTPRDLQIKFDHGLTFGPDLTGQFVFRTWEVETGRPLSPPIRIMIDPGNDRIESSPDGRRLLVADRLSTFRLWDVFSGQPVSPVITHDWLRQPGLSLVDDTGEAPSSTVGTGSSGPFANQTPNELAFNPAPSGRHAEFSPDGRRMVLVDDHGVTWVCDSATGKPVLPPVQTGDWWTVARFSPDGRSVYTVRSDGLIQTWDISRQDLSPRRLVDSNDEGFLYCKFIQDGRRLMVFGRDKGVCWIRFHDVETGHPVGRIALGDVHTGSPTFSRDGRLMAAVGMGEGRVYVWDVTTGKPIASEAVMSGGSFFEIPFTPDGREILTLSDSNQALLWELPARRGAAPKVLPIDISAVDRVEFSRDGRLLIARSLLNERAWDVRTWRLLPGCAAHNSEFSRHTKLSPDGTRVFRSEGGRGRVYDTRTAQPLTPILPVGSPSFVAFSPDGRRVVTINEDAKNRSTARTWDATTGRALSQPIRFDQIHRFAPVGAPAQFSPDGRGLLLLSNDGASLWDAETGTACWS